MSKLKLHIILVLALWLAFSGVAAAEQLYVNESGWRHDGGMFNASGAPIQAAVDAAGEGDAIYVYNGSYSENVDVNEQLTLEGEGADVVTVTAADSGDHVFDVWVDWVNISGFAVRGATDYDMAGIYLDNADYCNISENNVYGNYYGIGMWHSSDNNTLEQNTANSNNRRGIYLYDSSNNTLENNTASDNYMGGIYLSSSKNNIVKNNTASDNNGCGISLRYSNNNTLRNNNCPNNDGGICLSCSSDSTMRNNNCSNNGCGIEMSSSSNNNFTSNTVSNNREGVCLYNADNNNIACNRVQNNTQKGFTLRSGSTDNNISYNNIIENGNYNTTTGGWEWQSYIDQYQPVEAKHNYWGVGMNSSTIDASIYDDEEGGWGEVEFYPFETAPVPCAPGPKRIAFTTTDAAIALEIAAGSRPPDPRWDVSGDGSVTSLDALMILQAAVGNIEIG